MQCTSKQNVLDKLHFSFKLKLKSAVILLLHEHGTDDRGRHWMNTSEKSTENFRHDSQSLAKMQPRHLSITCQIL
jgi:hypothetical protein